MVFDGKMDFARKARWVKDGHGTPYLTTSAYVGMVFCESVQVALMYAAFMDLEVMESDIQNAYLQSPLSDQNFIVCRAKFG